VGWKRKGGNSFLPEKDLPPILQEKEQEKEGKHTLTGNLYLSISLW